MCSDIKISLSLLLIALYGCDSGKNFELKEDLIKNSTVIHNVDEKPIYDIRIEHTVTFSQMEKLTIGGVAIDDSGNVYIGDSQRPNIHSFNSKGQHKRLYTLEGRGPGELITPPLPIIISDTLYLFDPMQQRINVYSIPSMEIMNTINLDNSQSVDTGTERVYKINKIHPLKSSEFLGEFTESVFIDPTHPRYNADSLDVKFYLIDFDGNIKSDLIFEQRGDNYLTIEDGCTFKTANAPFLAQSLVSISEEGNIFSAWSENFLIEVRKSDGTYLSSFYYPFKKLPLNKEKAINDQKKIILNLQMLDVWKCIVNKVKLPSTWPAMNKMIVDDENKLWVSTITGHEKYYEWWVLDMKGNLLARFNWPKEQLIVDIKNGYLYSKEPFEGTGVLSKYNVDFTKR